MNGHEYVRPTARRLWDALNAGVDLTPAVSVDFGLDTRMHRKALASAVLRDGVTVQQLDQALGNGPALTVLVNRCPSNPYPGIVFKTSYDWMLEAHNGK